MAFDTATGDARIIRVKYDLEAVCRKIRAKMPQAAELEAHRAGCPICRSATQQLMQVRGMLREGLYEPAPAALRARLLERLAGERARPSLSERLRDWLKPAAGFVLGAASAAALLILLLAPATERLTQEIVASHIRALRGHLEDVASTDEHTVKPWFDGRLPFAPPVKELASAGFPLKGGRLDYLGGRTVAAIVYGYRRHVIDLYVWPQGEGSAAPRAAARHGYNLVHWTAGGMNLWAVSDAEPGVLRAFEEAWRGTP
jgi:anti-sigma factor RsiW